MEGWTNGTDEIGFLLSSSTVKSDLTYDTDNVNAFHVIHVEVSSGCLSIFSNVHCWWWIHHPQLKVHIVARNWITRAKIGLDPRISWLRDLWKEHKWDEIKGNTLGLSNLFSAKQAQSAQCPISRRSKCEVRCIWKLGVGKRLSNQFELGLARLKRNLIV